MHKWVVPLVAALAAALTLSFTIFSYTPFPGAVNLFYPLIFGSIGAGTVLAIVRWRKLGVAVAAFGGFLYLVTLIRSFIPVV